MLRVSLTFVTWQQLCTGQWIINAKVNVKINSSYKSQTFLRFFMLLAFSYTIKVVLYKFQNTFFNFLFVLLFQTACPSSLLQCYAFRHILDDVFSHAYLKFWNYTMIIYTHYNCNWNVYVFMFWAKRYAI